MNRGQRCFENIVKAGIVIIGLYILWKCAAIFVYESENSFSGRGKSAEVFLDQTADGSAGESQGRETECEAEDSNSMGTDCSIDTGFVKWREILEKELFPILYGSSGVPERSFGRRILIETEQTESETESEKKEIIQPEKEEAEKEEADHADPGTEKIQAGTEETEPISAETGKAETSETEIPDHIPSMGGLVKNERFLSYDQMLKQYYVIDPDTSVSADLIDCGTFQQMDLHLDKKKGVPQILIYHTHSQEAFADSKEGREEDTVVGLGEYLKTELEACGFTVIHDTGCYDLINGVLDRNAAYDYARSSVEKILQEYPDIEVVIDLHRDGVEGTKFVTEINQKPTARIMFFNGLSRDSSGNESKGLYNPYREENLAFSYQLQKAAEEQYPGLTRLIYLKGQRFNLHLKPRSLLVEAGTQMNTIGEEQNAMKLFAELLNLVLSRTAGSVHESGS